MTRKIALLAASALLLQGVPAIADDMPLIDAHIHYSHDAWDMLPPDKAVQALRAAGLTQAFVSSSSDLGTQKLYAEAPDLIVPVLRPYRKRGETGTWHNDPTVGDMVADLLAKNRYAGIGEFHVYGEDVEKPVVRRVVQLGFPSFCFIACSCEVAPAVVWREVVDGVSDGVPEIWEITGGGFSEECFDLGERQLDWVEVRAVGRQEAQLGACGLNRLADGRRFVSRQIVHHDDVAWLECGREDLLDIGEERRAVHGSVERHWRRHPFKTERANECGRLPVAMRHGRPAALASGRAAIAAGHLGRGSAFVDEDQALGVEIGLPIEPGYASPGDVRSILFASMRRLFLSVTSWRWKNRQTMLR